MSTQTQSTGKEVKELKTPKLFPMVKESKTPEETAKTNISAQIEKLASFNPQTAEEKIKRVAEFEALSKRYTQLKEKQHELNLFVAGNDKTNAKVSLENQAGFKMEIRNSNVINKVLNTMQDELNILLLEADNEVLTFQI
jgi:hypothetical protein